jgi:hypothetical protein
LNLAHALSKFKVKISSCKYGTLLGRSHLNP